MRIPRWYGRAALAAFVAFTSIDILTYWIPVARQPDQKLLPLKRFLFNNLFRSWLPDKHASWLYSVVAILLLSLLFRALERRKWYLRA